MTDVLPLLWRKKQRARTGRPPKLTLDAVVDRAIATADEAGLESVTMARVATALGVGTMTLYSYVPSREVLIDLMVDEVSARRAFPAPGEPRPASWRDQVLLYDGRTRAMYAQHPWLARVSQIRPPPGPGLMAEREYVLSCVAGSGLPRQRWDEAAIAIQMFVTSAAHAAAEDELLRRSTGQTTEEWWQAHAAVWEDWFDVERHPTMTELWLAGGFAEGSSSYGLTLILDALDAVTPG